MSVIYRVFYENYKVCLKRSVNGIRKQQKTRFKQTKFIGLQNNRHFWQRSKTFWKLPAKASLGIARRTAVTRSCQLVRHIPGTDLPLTQIFTDDGVHRVLANAQILRHQL